MIDEEADYEEVIPPRPASVATAIGIAFNFLSNIGRSCATLFEDFSVMCGNHAEVDHDRQDAYAAMHRDLEML